MKTILIVAAAFANTFFLTSVSLAQVASSAAGLRISVADFGATPNDEKNDAAGLRKAIEVARERPGTVLYFPPGVYNFRDEAAVQLMDEAMTGKFGPNPEPILFKPYYPYIRGLDFRGVSGLTIEAEGATLLCEGWMEPLSIDQAKDVTIRGLTIDYKRRAYSEGAITEVGKDYFDAVIEPLYPINPRMPIPRVMYWDPQAHRMIGASVAGRYEIVASRTVRIYPGQEILSLINTNTTVGLMHSMHFRPAILIQQADNIRLENVVIHSQTGMGIVAHRSSNLTFSGLRVTPPAGSFFSVTTDATHFTSCSGLIRIENSQFEGQGDDAVNIHNYYYSIAKADQPGKYNLTVPLNTHAAVLDYPDVGDSMDVVSATSLEPVKSVVVKAVAIYPKELRTEVEFEGVLPVDLNKYYVVNTTRLPKVEIISSIFLSHLARGILIKTRNVLIENNLLFESTGTAIQIAAEGGWREGVPSANVVIRGNRIIGGGHGKPTVAQTSAIAVNIDSTIPSTARLHHGLLIENNSIVGAGSSRCIFISQADTVEIKNNQISGCKTPIFTENSDNVSIHNNSIVASTRLRSDVLSNKY